SPIPDGDRHGGRVAWRRLPSFDDQVLPALRPRRDIYPRQFQWRRAGTEPVSVGVEVLEYQTRRRRIAAIPPVRPTQWLYRAAIRRSERVAATIPEIPISVGRPVQTVPAAPDESHRLSRPNVAAQWGVQRHLKALCALGQIFAAGKAGAFRTGSIERAGRETGDPMTFPVGAVRSCRAVKQRQVTAVRLRGQRRQRTSTRLG